jgi:hypothetical protein
MLLKRLKKWHSWGIYRVFEKVGQVLETDLEKIVNLVFSSNYFLNKRT